MHDIDPARLALAEQLAHISLRHHGRERHACARPPTVARRSTAPTS